MARADLIQTYIDAKTASSMGVPPPAAELRAEAEQAVTEAVAKIEAMRQAGVLKDANAKYRAYRLTMMERGKRALPYSVFLERRTATIVRQIAATGRMI
jgi:hypothetical protein